LLPGARAILLYLPVLMAILRPLLCARSLLGIRRKPAEILMSTDPAAPAIEPNAWNVVGTIGERSGA
jgi:hypothetical protein